MHSIKYFTALCALLCIPSASFAFTASNQTATVLQDNAAVFTLEYTFSSNDEPLYVPVFGSREPSHTQFGWRVRANDEPGQADAAVAFVASDAAIVNGMYEIPANSTKTFTAIMVVVAPAGAEPADYHTDIKALPFFIGENRQPAPLNPSELKTFVTPSVAL